MFRPGPTLALQHPPPANINRLGYQVNVLGSSLVARLKQRPPGQDQARHAARASRSTKPSASPGKKGKVTAAAAALGIRLEGLEEEEGGDSSDGGLGSGRSRRQRPRANSAASGDSKSTSPPPLPRLASSMRSLSGSRVGSRIASRRSLSAGLAPQRDGRGAGGEGGGGGGAGMLVMRAPSCPVHVVKRDGVFQPADKYMSGRLGIRDAGGEATTLWEYHTYMLPALDAASMETGLTGQASPEIPENWTSGMYLGSGKKRMKVSWKAGSSSSHPGLDVKVSEHNINEGGSPESRQDTTIPSQSFVNRHASSSSCSKRAQSSASSTVANGLGFRRPVYSSGRSQVSSIGLRWQILTQQGQGTTASGSSSHSQQQNNPAREEGEGSAQQAATPSATSTKPMWSYLVTHETTSTTTKPHQPSPSSEAVSSSAPRPPRAAAAPEVINRKSHRRDVHPVSTALERTGMSVSRTRWAVPSSSASGLEAERAVRDRLQLVKRPAGARLGFNEAGGATSNSAAQRFRQAMVEAGEEEGLEDQKAAEGGGEGSESPVGVGRGEAHEVEERRTQGTASTTQDDKACSTREGDVDDQRSSPTKSRSTYCN